MGGGEKERGGGGRGVEGRWGGEWKEDGGTFTGSCCWTVTCRERRQLCRPSEALHEVPALFPERPIIPAA